MYFYKHWNRYFVLSKLLCCSYKCLKLRQSESDDVCSYCNLRTQLTSSTTPYFEYKKISSSERTTENHRGEITSWRNVLAITLGRIFHDTLIEAFQVLILGKTLTWSKIHLFIFNIHFRPVMHCFSEWRESLFHDSSVCTKTIFSPVC